MINKEIIDMLVCPCCKGKLLPEKDGLKCAGCLRPYPVVEGTPVLLNDETSIFKTDDFRKKISTTIDLGQHERGFLRKAWGRVAPNLTLNLGSKRNFDRFKNVILTFNARPEILVIGGSVIGSGIYGLLKDQRITLVETDVSFGPRTQIICDAHDLPLAEGSFDGVVVQAVLEHVPDPYRCVSEIHRVLKQGGIVYSETPFMQQVHMGRYDFTRFTDLGHRRLFSRFDEIDRGVLIGPATALAWSVRSFLSGFTDSRILKKIINAISGLLFFWIKYFDYILIRKKSSYDAASGFFFLGRKSDRIISDREMIGLYRGADNR